MATSDYHYLLVDIASTNHSFLASWRPLHEGVGAVFVLHSVRWPLQEQASHDSRRTGDVRLMYAHELVGPADGICILIGGAL